jgi:very-short-patch-repair endonuclease
MHSFISHQTALKMLGVRSFANYTGSIHLSCTEKNGRLRDGSVQAHYVTGPLPRNAIRRIGEADLVGMEAVVIGDNWVAGPELAFFQMAEVLSLHELILLGLEMCAKPDRSVAGSVQSSPLTNAAKIAKCVEKMHRHRGSYSARRAAKYLADGSASIMESLSYMLLCLPPMLGGYGLKGAEFNHKIALSKAIKKSTIGMYFYCDLYWPKQRVAVEYDSTLHHTTSKQLTDNAVRRSILANQNITVMTLTARQLQNQIALERFAKLLAKNLGHRLRADRIVNQDAQSAMLELVRRSMKR